MLVNGYVLRRMVKTIGIDQWENELERIILNLNLYYKETEAIGGVNKASFKMEKRAAWESIRLLAKH